MRTGAGGNGDVRYHQGKWHGGNSNMRHYGGKEGENFARDKLFHVLIFAHMGDSRSKRCGVL